VKNSSDGSGNSVVVGARNPKPPDGSWTCPVPRKSQPVSRIEPGDGKSRQRDPRQGEFFADYDTDTDCVSRLRPHRQARRDRTRWTLSEPFVMRLQDFLHRQYENAEAPMGS